MNITIIGTGKMARGLSIFLMESGNQVNLVGHTPGKAEALAEELKGMGKGGSISASKDGKITGEIVMLAVPYSAAEAVIKQYNEQLAGKTLVDVTNLINYQKMEPLMNSGGSGAELLAKQVPNNTQVVKAFTTVFSKTLPTGKVAGMPLDVFMAGDDAESKVKLAQLIEAGGLRAIDAGPLARARELEAMGFLQVALQNTLKTGYMSAIKILA